MTRAEPDPLPPTLFLVVDAIPFDVAEEVWRAGDMPGFAAPRPMVSVFPGLTHVAVPALLAGAFPARPPGYEVRYLHPPSGEIRGGFGVPGAEEAMRPFRVRPDGVIGHGAIYPLPSRASWAQIRWITHRSRAEGGPWLGYLWASDAVGHFEGRERLLASLSDVCRQVQRARTEVAERDGVEPEVVLASDHGMAFGPLVHLSAEMLAAHLGVFGFSEDAVGMDHIRLVPFGDVSAGVVYCDPTRAAPVAEAVATAPGVRLAFSATADGFQVWRTRGRIERARMERATLGATAHWRYQGELGDPLDLGEPWSQISDTAGWAEDEVVLNRTATHTFPDALHRVWQGLTSLVQWPAPVLFSLDEGYTYGPAWSHAGAALLGGQVGTHGALDRAASLGFAAATHPGDPWAGRAILRPGHVFAPWRDLLRAGGEPARRS